MTKFLEKRDLPYPMSENDPLTGHGIIELHALRMIGKTEAATVTGIARALHLTKGAISKTIRKQTGPGLIRSYIREDYRKMILF